MPNLNHLLDQEPHAPPLAPVGWIRAAERDQVRLGSSIQYSPSRSAGLLGHQRRLKAFFAKAFALTSYGSGGNLKGLCDPLVGPAVWPIGIGLREDASIEQLARVSPAATN